MKKITIALLLSILTLPTFAETNKTNVMFGDKMNSVTLYAAQSTGSGTLFKLINPTIWDFYPQTLVLFQYSQPMQFFRLDSRLNFNLTQNFAYNNDKGLSFFAASVSIDTALLQYHNWYLGIGIGPYMRDSRDRWVESRLVFGEKFFIGKSLNENWNFELYTIHFSNGNFTNANEGFNFVGFGVGYKF